MSAQPTIAKSTIKNKNAVPTTPSIPNLNPNTIKVIVWMVSTIKAKINACMFVISHLTT